MLLLFLFLFSMALAGDSTIAVLDISSYDVSSQDASVFTLKLQSDLTHLGSFRVIERDDLSKILKEQGLQLSGAAGQAVEVGKIAGISKAVTGQIGCLGDSSYFIALKLLDMETGEILKSGYEEVMGGFSDCLVGSEIALRKLFGLKVSKSVREIKTPVRSVEIHTHKDTIAVEHHVFKHNNSKGHPVFVPCSYCRGKGYTTENGKEIDCPFCNRYMTYVGKETRFTSMTGRWQE